MNKQDYEKLLRELRFHLYYTKEKATELERMANSAQMNANNLRRNCDEATYNVANIEVEIENVTIAFNKLIDANK